MTQTTITPPAEGNGALAARLQSVLSDPEQLTRLTALAGSLASSGALGGLFGPGAGITPSSDLQNDVQNAENVPVSDGAEGDETAGSDGEPPTAEAAPLSVQQLARPHGAASWKATKHEALLCALRPYLSAERQTRVDQMLRLLKLLSLAQNVLAGSTTLTGL